MSRDHAVLLATLALTWSTLGCAHDGRRIGQAEDTPAAETAAPGASVEVTNSHWSDINVYAIRDGMNVRLGTVTSMTSRTFRLPRSLMAGLMDLRLHADPIGSRYGYTSPEILVGAGRRVVWRVENNLSLSSYAVRD